MTSNFRSVQGRQPELRQQTKCDQPKGNEENHDSTAPEIPAAPTAKVAGIHRFGRDATRSTPDRLEAAPIVPETRPKFD
jgi:hypothetical protein